MEAVTMSTLYPSLEDMKVDQVLKVRAFPCLEKGKDTPRPLPVSWCVEKTLLGSAWQGGRMNHVRRIHGKSSKVQLSAGGKRALLGKATESQHWAGARCPIVPFLNALLQGQAPAHF